MAETNSDWYTLLGVPNTASPDVILKAFRQKALEFHPDKNPNRPECEELMKTLTQAKHVLLDSEQREKYDDTYTVFENDINAEKEFLYSGERQSEFYRRKYEKCKQEYESYSFDDNYNEVKQVLKQFNIDFMKSRDEMPPYRVTKFCDKYFTYLDSKKVTDFENELKKQFPSSLWNLSEVQSEKSSLFSRVYCLLFGCDYLARGNRLFAQNQYNQALYFYIKINNGQLLHDKCMTLLAAQNKACPLYARALMKIDGFGHCASNVLTKWLIDNEHKDPIDLLVSACSINKDQQGIDIHEKVLEYFTAKNMSRDLIKSTCLYLLNRDKECKLAIKTIAHLIEKHYITDKSKVTELLYASSITNMILYILEHRCHKAATDVYIEMTKNKNFDSLPSRYKASLYLLNAACNKVNENTAKCINLCKKALYACPTDDIQQAICSILGDCAIFDSITKLLIKNQEIKIPTKHSFDGFLKSSACLRSTFRFEKSILQQELSNFDKAMLYVDLGMSSIGLGITTFCNNYLIAATFLLQEMLADNENPTNKYALRELIFSLISNVIYIAKSYSNPITAMYFYEKSLYLMSSAHRLLGQSIELHTSRPIHTKLVPDMQQMLLVTICNELTRLAKVTPLTYNKLQLSTDILFLDIIGHQFLEQFYAKQLNTYVPNHPLTNLYKYHLLELNWINNGDEEQFNILRENLMDAVLEGEGWNARKVEALLGWPLINRDDYGFMDRERPWLNIENGSIISVEGVNINFETGLFEPIFTNSPPGHSGLVSIEDALEIFEKGIGSSFFTLDQPRVDMQYHCCQEMKYFPGNLKDTNFLATLLHADYLLKMFTLGNEVSAKKPFAFQSTYDNLLEGLPEHLRKVLMPLHERRNGTPNGQVHRFWIEPCKILYFTINEDENSKTFIFFDVIMKVKKHSMKYDKNGKLVDDEDDDEDDENEGGNDYDKKKEPSPEKQFTNEFTKHYDEISTHFQVFARLKELLKLAAITEILKSVANSFYKARSELKVDIKPVIPILDELQSKFREHYPRNTSSNRSKYYNELLRENGIYDDSNVEPSSRDRALLNIQDQLQQIDQTIIETVQENLAKMFGIELYVNKNYPSAVKKWMDCGYSRLVDDNDLPTIVATAIKNKRAEQLGCFEKNLISLGFNSLANDDLDNKINWNKKSGDFCVFVPAAFKRHDNSRVYGGVNLGVKLMEVPNKIEEQNDKKHGNSKYKMAPYHIYKVVATQRSFRKADPEMRQMYGSESYIGISQDKNIYLNKKHNGFEQSKRGNKTARKHFRETGIKYVSIVIKKGLISNLHARCEEAMLINKGQKATGAGKGYFASANKFVPDLHKLYEDITDPKNTDFVPKETIKKMEEMLKIVSGT
ncbi:uncharacterized protein LOC136085713 [Hydra vulgaris]|uniref:Uncharacterized protein LOC136085713 n=1 Tax=Hydra vulgaris TaxID=6087 RepID=A0ABM4CMR4_HYDVU